MSAAGRGGAPRGELGPWLGVVAGPRARPRPGGVDLDPVRLALVARLVREAQEGQPDWLAAWAEAAREASRRTLGQLRAAAAAAALESRAPERVARSAAPGPDDARTIEARIESAGIPLERVVQALAPGGAAASHFPRAGGAVEEAWLELERVVATIGQEWAPRIGGLRAWRRPTAGLWVLTGVAGAAALLVGLMIGGYLPAPGWLKPVVRWWWRLPWP